MIDSVILPFFEFKVFENRQQIVPENLEWKSKYAYFDMGTLRSIDVYKDKIFVLLPWGVMVFDIQKKSIEYLIYYKLFLPVNLQIPTGIEGVSWYLKKESKPLHLIRMKNDTLVISQRKPVQSLLSDDISTYIDTILVTLDGENIVPKVRNELCLKVWHRNGRELYVSPSCPIQDGESE